MNSNSFDVRKEIASCNYTHGQELAAVKVEGMQNVGQICKVCLSRKFELKVAEHSFSARFCWCKFARAQGFQKTNMPSTERSFYLLKTRIICVIFLYNCMQCIDGFSILLQRYVTKGNDAKNPAFLAFVCYRKNPVKCNACAVARKIETDCFCRNLPISNDPVVRISRNFAKNSSQTTQTIYHEKSEFWHN